jgi:23S rRNA pseudouridine1911/1915/1917 synthase
MVLPKSRGITPTPSDAQWTIGSEAAGARLDKFLAAPERLGSRARAAAALERGKVFVNGVEASLAQAAIRLAHQDVVRVWMDRPGTARPRLKASESVGPLQIVHEDEVLLVINKPAGILAVPLDRQPNAPSVLQLLNAHLRHLRRRAFVVHRIDRDTSGLVVFTTDARAQQRLKIQFKRHEPERVYLAVVYGHPDPPEGTWRDRLVWDSTALIQKETHPRDARGKEAVSHYRVLETFKDTSLVEIKLQTGKRNQIRLQARLRGHTLVGERRYVYGPDHLRPIAFPRQALHAARLAFRHPTDGRPVQFEAPIPVDLKSLIDRLRRRGDTRERRPDL